MRSHARETGTISGLRLARTGADPARRSRRSARASRATSTTSSSRRDTSKAPTGSFRWTRCAASSSASSRRSTARAPSRPTRRSARSPCARSCRRSGSGFPRRSREILGAFSDGVNAAMEREPLPVEFRILAYRPAPWTPRDSLAVAMVTVLDLIDDWDAIARRDAPIAAAGLALLDARFPFTDPCYDAPVLAGLARIAPGPALPAPRRDAGARARRRAPADRQQRVGRRREPHAASSRAARQRSAPRSCRCPACGICSICARRAFTSPAPTLPGCPRSCSATTSESPGARPTARSRRSRRSCRRRISIRPAGTRNASRCASGAKRRSDTIARRASSARRPRTGASCSCTGTRTTIR